MHELLEWQEGRLFVLEREIASLFSGFTFKLRLESHISL